LTTRDLSTKTLNYIVIKKNAKNTEILFWGEGPSIINELLLFAGVMDPNYREKRRMAVN